MITVALVSLSYKQRCKTISLYTTYELKQKAGLLTAISIVIANMIGTGVFTSLGFQLSAVQNTVSILLLWTAGGVLSLFGAFAYAELGTHFKESGGDYIYLSRLFHPVLGYLSAWAGLTAGFSAAVALAAIAFVKYLSPLGLPNAQWTAIALILLIGCMHSFTLKSSSYFQNATKGIKVFFIVILIVLAFLLPPQAHNALTYDTSWQREVLQPGFAVSMVYVSFAYTGWNAAAYVAGEIKNPRRNLPFALIGSTLFVSLVYVLFQVALLRNGSLTQLMGKEDVTSIAFANLLGANGGKWVSAFIAIQLVATISSYLWVGPRVTAAMANEFTLWKPIARQNKHGIPVAAIWLHVGIGIGLVLTGSFEKVLLYAGFVLQLMASLTVATSLRIGRNKDGAFTTPFKPLLQVVFLAFSLWVLVFTFIDRPTESLAGMGILGLGLCFYFFDKRVPQKNKW